MDTNIPAQPTPAPQPHKPVPSHVLVGLAIVLALLGLLAVIAYLANPGFFTGVWKELVEVIIVNPQGEKVRLEPLPPYLPQAPAAGLPDDGEGTQIHLVVSPSNAVVRLVDGEGNGKDVHQCRVPPEGRVMLDKLVRGRLYDLLVSLPGHQGFVGMVEAGQHGLHPSDPYRVLLDQQPGQVLFRIFPFASLDLWRGGERRPTARAGPDGVLNVTGLREGDWLYRITLDKHAAVLSGSFTVVESKNDQVVERIPPPLDGTFTLAGHPDLLVITADNRAFKANEAIRIPPGTHELTVLRDGFRSALLTVEISPNQLVTKPAPELVPLSDAEASPVDLFPDLEPVADAKPAPLDGLAEGSCEAQRRQIAAIRRLGYPLEQRTREHGFTFVFIPNGSFSCGSPDEEQQSLIRSGARPDQVEDEIQHPVTLGKGFYLMKFEVTQAQWRRVMGDNPSYFQHAGDNAPVENVSWDEVQAFVLKFCQLLGVPSGTYRLPTESEWEYACRAGTSTTLYTGNYRVVGECHATGLDAISWYSGNATANYAGGLDSSRWLFKQINHNTAGPQPVGGKMPNAFGLHDMIGNVSEWTMDPYGAYPTGKVSDPLAAGAVDRRVVRGGGWMSRVWFCRAADRFWMLPMFRAHFVGFRLVRTTP